MLGELLNWPAISPCMKMELEDNQAILSREIEGGNEVLEVSLPFIAGCQEPISEWKIPTMRGIMMARKKQLEVLDPIAVEQTALYKNFHPSKKKKGMQKD